ncbi:MAG: YggT family protein [Anaerolineales bacterium]
MTEDSKTREIRRAEIEERRYTLTKVSQAIWLVLGILEAAIGIRVLLKLLAANPEAGFARFVYSFTAIFLAPFENLFNNPAVEGAVFEFSSIIAMLVYALITWGIVRLIWITFDISARPEP